MVDPLRNLQWGQDANGVWHLFPFFRMDGSNVMLDWKCTVYSTLVVREPITQPPPGGIICRECRAVVTSILVEQE